MDDVFDEDVDIEDREWAKMEEKHTNIGYKKGLEDGGEVLLQTGFNKAFAIYAESAFKISQLRGKLCGILAFNLMKQSRNKLTDEKVQELENLVEKIRDLETRLEKCESVPEDLIPPESVKTASIDKVDTTNTSKQDEAIQPEPKTANYHLAAACTESIDETEESEVRRLSDARSDYTDCTTQKFMTELSKLSEEVETALVGINLKISDDNS